MTSTARDVRYGRRSGNWVEARLGPDVCHTCRNGTARWLARHLDNGETWQVCKTCRDQAERYRCPITHTALDGEVTS